MRVNARALATPAPPPPWSAAERNRVRAALRDIFTSDIATASSGLVVLAADGSTLYSNRGTVAVTPASTLKLVVAATALEALGPKRRFETRFVASAPPDAGGTLAGGLWLVGGGDPMLVSDDLRRGVGVLARSGIKRIDGELQIDDTSFMGPEQNPNWDPDDLGYDYAAGTSAIALDWGVVEFEVTPGQTGGPARVRVVPANDAIVLEGTITTVPSGSSSFVTIVRKSAAMPTFHTGSGGSDAPTVTADTYFVEGRIAQGETQKFYKPVLGMPGYVGGIVAAMLAERRIALAAGYRAGAAPPGAQVLWAHRSPPLEAILKDMLVYSNNHSAETLLRIVGERTGRPGTDQTGIAAEKSALAKLGVRYDRMRVFDGSGLAPGDKIMPLTLAQVIAAELRGRNADVFLRSLPRVGYDGTVKHHNLTSALGRTRAKSGHIENVNGLAGTVATLHHGRVAFAFVVNDRRANADIVTQEEDRALDALARS
ncbi:MAG: D-alanyl-D-alanine carboxypeptidase/D-alanyl-D-alanine-endopeptidase [Vulcanimicrobiaceae bacterium]